MSTPSVQDLKFSLNIPNGITFVRIFLAIPIALLLYQGNEGSIFLAGILLVIAASTDWLDGFLARRLGQESLVGSILDIVADQILFMPSLILAITAGLFSGTNDLMPLNPYPYAVPALAGGVTVLTGIGFYLWKRRSRVFEFPTPTGVAKVNYWFWLAPLIVAIFGIGPDILLAVLMYLAIISTVLTFYSYLKKGSYVFTD
ncbi:CDP-alcohol phosphatidyltransferase family protein [Chloroflexota bacterium]